MGIFQIAGLILNSLTLLPKIISAFNAVSQMSKRYKDGGLRNDIQVTADIVGEVCRLAQEGEKSLAKVNLIETRNRAKMGDRDGIHKQLESLKKRRTAFDSANTVEKV